jgi:short-subunit dehydrogenase involved in D-alanine esterification of teichoic acids
MNLEKYGPWALIIGGSEGVGASFARKLAASGFKLVLVARKLPPLQGLADELTKAGTEVRIASVDMSKPDALHRVRAMHLNIGFTATPAMARLGYDLSTATPPDVVAQEGIDNIANGPIWIAGGESNRQTARRRSTVDGRAEAVRAHATPGRNTRQEDRASAGGP